MRAGCSRVCSRYATAAKCAISTCARTTAATDPRPSSSSCLAPSLSVWPSGWSSDFPAAVGARLAVADRHDAARDPADAAGQGGAGRAAIPASGDRDGVVNGRLRRLLGPGVMTSAMLVVLMGLGTWQVRRLHWKRLCWHRSTCRGSACGRRCRRSRSPIERCRRPVVCRRSVRHLRRRGARYARGPGTRHATDNRSSATAAMRSWSTLAGSGQATAPIAQPDGELTMEGYVRPSDNPGLFPPPTIRPGANSIRSTRRRSARRSACRRSRRSRWSRVGPAPSAGYPEPAGHLPRPPNNHCPTRSPGMDWPWRSW